MAILVVTGSLRAMKVQAVRVASRVAEIVRAMATSKTAALVQAVRAVTRRVAETVKTKATPPTPPTPRRHRRLLLRESSRQRIPRPTRLRRSSQPLHSTSRHQYPLPRIALVLSTAINTSHPAL